MKISTKGRYGLRAMLDLALHANDEPTLLKDIAERIHVSNKYLEHIMSALKKAGLVTAKRGSGGGYILSRSPEQIKIIDIIEALEGSVSPSDCVDNPDICNQTENCVAHFLWKKIYDCVHEVLSTTTLAHLMEAQAGMSEPPQCPLALLD